MDQPKPPLPEQKNARPPERKGGNPATRFLVLLGVIAAIYAYFTTKKKSAPQDISPRNAPEESAPPPPKERDEKAGSASPVSGGQAGGASSAETKAAAEPKAPDATPINAGFFDEAVVKKNEDVIKNFASVAYLDVPHIPGMQYTMLDLDDDLDGIYLYNPQSKIELTMLARAGAVTEEQLMAFLAEGDHGIPSLRGIKVPALGAAYTEAAPPNSGLKDSKSWTFSDGTFTYQIALLPRQDGKGTYLAVIKAPGQVIENGEESYDKYYQQLKVRN